MYAQHGISDGKKAQAAVSSSKSSDTNPLITTNQQLGN